MGDVDDDPFDPRRFRETAYDREHRTRGAGPAIAVLVAVVFLVAVLGFAVWLMVHR